MSVGYTVALSRRCVTYVAHLAHRLKKQLEEVRKRRIEEKEKV